MKMKLFFGIILAVSAFCLNMSAAEPAVPLWTGAAPGAHGSDPEKDIPAIAPFFPPPESSTGTAVIICPGGAYGALSTHEGEDYARWFNDNGIAAFVLKYRLGTNGYRYPVMQDDVLRAIRLVRSRAAEWRLKSDRIGIIGSSAGGHLASLALTHFDPGNLQADDPVERVSSRPDFGILCYPVITMGKHGHDWSRRHLLGRKPTPETITLTSGELQVRPDMPPCFLWHSGGDRLVSVVNTLQFVEALQSHGIPYEVHIYQYGDHGAGLGLRNYNPQKRDKVLPWTGDLIRWMKKQRYI